MGVYDMPPLDRSVVKLYEFTFQHKQSTKRKTEHEECDDLIEKIIEIEKREKDWTLLCYEEVKKNGKKID